MWSIVRGHCFVGAVYLCRWRAFCLDFPKISTISTKHESFGFSLCVLGGGSLTPVMALEIRYAILVISSAILCLEACFRWEYTPSFFILFWYLLCSYHCFTALFPLSRHSEPPQGHQGEARPLLRRGWQGARSPLEGPQRQGEGDLEEQARVDVE